MSEKGCSSEIVSNEELDLWMSKLPPDVQRIPLTELLIPGSHDSFSYSLKMGKVSPDAPFGVSFLGAIPFISGPAFLRWGATQRSTVYEQLTHGIRYFDIRVTVKDKRFFFVHLLFGDDLEPLLREIKKFLDSRPGEVVLLDFQHFYGLTEKDHSILIALVNQIFSDLICPPDRSLDSLSLSLLMKRKHQVLVFYRNRRVEAESNFWPGYMCPNPWPQTTTLFSLIPFIENEIRKKSTEKFFVTQCVLTPTGNYIAKNIFTSLEKALAIPCNEQILQWILSLSLDDQSPNIVMTDFVEYSDWSIPKAVIQHNFSRSVLTDKNL